MQQMVQFMNEMDGKQKKKLSQKADAENRWYDYDTNTLTICTEY